MGGDRGEVTIGGVVVPRVKKFKYLGSMVEEGGDIDDDISHQIKVWWQKWRKAAGVLYDKKIPFKLKGKVYRIVIL